MSAPVELAPGGRGERLEALLAALAARILVLDGATGTALQGRGLTAADFGGAEYEGCNEHLVLTRPDVVADVHDGYLEAGCDVVETNTFGATPLVLAEYGLADRAEEINRRAARIAREACARFERPGAPRFVAGSMGPTTRALSVTGGATFEELVEHFRVQARGLIDGGADYLLLETCQDTRNVKAGLLGIDAAFADLAARVPVAVSGTIEPTGTMLAGQGVEALAISLMHRDLLYLGLNCATGPSFMTDHVRSLAALAPFRVACVPNAGLPDEDGCYREGPDDVAAVLARFAGQGWLNLVGGCCGTTPAHVRALVAAVRGRAPRVPPAGRRTWLSGVDWLEVGDDVRPVIVGERTNVLGSRKFKALVREGRWDEAVEVGRAQVKGGAHLIDVCLQDPDADERANMDAFLARLTRAVKVPLVIDSTDAVVMERALTWCQGKALLNSVNLEDGLERFEKVVPLARRYGAALVVGLIDEDKQQGMAVTVERKLAVARRSHAILTRDFGVPEEDLVFDPLVFPCGTGDRAYLGSAQATIEGVRAVKQAFPRCKTVLGISNVSFGLPEAGRETLNSVFLYHCVQAGLDLAIVNSERLERYPSISADDRRVCEDLLFLRGDDPVAAFAAHFRGRAGKGLSAARQRQADRPLEERLAGYVIEGSKDGLTADLDLALKDPRWPQALDVINGPLMAGMAEVGRLFNANQLIVAEVLQSAEAMKAAVAHLEPHMPKGGGPRRGRVLLATVKGDVHDIGKNLVDIVLSNNGFEVVNLGIKIPSEALIEAARKHAPDLIGLSGLLVKSAQMMVTTAEDLREAGIDAPLLVGGAALSPAFTYRRIAPAYRGPVAYARDAMSGLSLANRFQDPVERGALVATLDEEEAKAAAAPERAAAVAARRPAGARSAAVRADVPRPATPPLARTVLDRVDLDTVWAWLNPQMLYGKHLGLRGHVPTLLAERDPKAVKLEQVVGGLMERGRAGGLRVRAVYRWFPVTVEGETVVVLDPEGGGERERFTFPRQRAGEGLCLADYVVPGPDGRDHVGLFVTTAGEGVRAEVERLRHAGRYVESHALGSLAVETAEAAAEWLHGEMRRLWGFPDPATTSMEERFRCAYRGKRYSFGYPACPDLADQEKLFRLLRPEEIGVQLTEGHMMDPEASVSALVLHHPDARYFSA